MALWDEAGVLAARSEEAAGRHSDLMVQSLVSLLEPLGLRASDIGAIAVAHGPGSFTGLRVGLSFAKGLAMGLGVKIIPLNTLRAMARSSQATQGILSPLLDAKKNQVYTALYRLSEGDIEVLKGPTAVDPTDWLSHLPLGTIVFGSGAVVYRRLIEAEGERLSFRQDPQEPTPQGLIDLAREEMARGNLIGWEEIDAYYIRPADALPPRCLKNPIP